MSLAEIFGKSGTKSDRRRARDPHGFTGVHSLCTLIFYSYNIRTKRKCLRAQRLTHPFLKRKRSSPAAAERRSIGNRERKSSRTPLHLEKESQKSCHLLRVIFATLLNIRFFKDSILFKIYLACILLYRVAKIKEKEVQITGDTQTEMTLVPGLRKTKDLFPGMKNGWSARMKKDAEEIDRLKFVIEQKDNIIQNLTKQLKEMEVLRLCIGTKEES